MLGDLAGEPPWGEWRTKSHKRRVKEGSQWWRSDSEHKGGSRVRVCAGWETETPEEAITQGSQLQKNRGCGDGEEVPMARWSLA